jgi:hypothetical protein
VERIEEIAVNTMFTSTKRKVSAEAAANSGAAEQQRLKAAAADRRAAATTHERAEAGRWATPERGPSVAPRSKYLA